jgi:sulfoxide reductase heme-binding subunit YedZ
MNHFWWYVARSSGLVAWFLLVASLVIGALYSGRMTGARRRRGLLDLHPWLSGLALGAVVLHVVAIVADSYVRITPVQALLPFASTWRPVAVAWGAIALWLMLFVQVTAFARKYMARRTWHAIHLTSYALAILATIHSVTAGTDTVRAPVRWSMAAVVVFATAVSVWRVVAAGAARRGTAPARSVPVPARPVPPRTAPPPPPLPVESFRPVGTLEQFHSR